MKYICLFFSFVLFAQDNDGADGLENSSTTGSVGTVTINGEIYNQMSLRPEIPIGKLGIGLDVYLYFNDEGMYWDGWDFSDGGSAYQTIVDKIYYLRWGRPSDKLYVLAGAMPSATLGEGILVNRYSNLMQYPQVRQVGLHLKAQLFEKIGIEIINSNFKVSSPGVLGARASWELIPNLSLGFSAATDLNQNAGLNDSDGDNYPDYYDQYPDDPEKHDDSLKWRDTYGKILESAGITNDIYSGFDEWYKDQPEYNSYNPDNVSQDPVSGYAFDFSYKISNKVSLYTQFAQLMGHIDTSMINPLIKFENDSYNLGWGFIPIGLRAKLGPVHFVAEYRMNSRNFIFNYWDRAYDASRVTIGDYGILSKESQLYLYGELKGVYVQADMNLMNIINLNMGYQNISGEMWNNSELKYKSDEKNQTFLSTVSIKPSAIPKVGKAEAFYQQSNVPNPFEFEPTSSTIWGYDLGIEVSDGVLMVYKARTTYIADIDNPDSFIPVESIQIETQFIF